jgi:hypothetical protein
MYPIISKLVSSILLGAATLTNPTTPKALSFDASAYVTTNNQIRLSVIKAADTPVMVYLKDQDNEVLYHQIISKKDEKHAIVFTLNDLPDGEYEIEVKSKEGSIKKQLKIASAPVRETSRLIAVQ